MTFIQDDDSFTTYTPFVNDERGIAGFKAERGEQTTYIYLCPCGGSDDGVPCVFLYIGPEADPCHDAAAHFYDLTDEIGRNFKHWNRSWPAPRPEAALSFDECEAAGVDGTLRGMT